jgi:hypothetical protein
VGVMSKSKEPIRMWYENIELWKVVHLEEISAQPEQEPETKLEPILLDEYDAGLLSDFGSGDVSWWQDYMRAELERAHDYYQSQVNQVITQPKQEPVAWMYDLDMMIHPISNTKVLRFGELTSINPTVRPLQDAVNIRPLYTAPPKREPLSEIEIRSGYNANLHMTMKAFREGVKFAEKAHGMGFADE